MDSGDAIDTGIDPGFRPMILPEQAAPECAGNCRRCEVSTHGTRMVWGEGNPSASVVVLLDNPGAREDKEGLPYVCGTRETLQYAIVNTGIPLGDVYVTYLLKCRPVKKYDKDKARTACMSYFLEQLSQIRPKVLMCLGDVAVKYYFSDQEATVKKIRGAMHERFGINAVASYHPLAVRRRPNLLPLFLEDWGLLKTILLNTSPGLEKMCR